MFHTPHLRSERDDSKTGTTVGVFLKKEPKSEYLAHPNASVNNECDQILFSKPA